MHTQLQATPPPQVYWTQQADDAFFDGIANNVAHPGEDEAAAQIVIGTHSLRIEAFARARGQRHVNRQTVLEYFADMAGAR